MTSAPAVPTGAHRPHLPAWQLFVAGIVGVAVVTSGVAGITVLHEGLRDPVVFALAAAGAAVVNLIYVVVLRKRDVFEAIDISEAPIVALALLLPPAEALVAFAAGTIAGELLRRRAPIKKAFNAGIRIAGAGVAVMFAGAGHLPDRVGVVSIALLLLGTALYTLITATGVASVLSLIEHRSVFGSLTEGFGMRTVVWASAVLLGVSAANLAVSRPVALVGLAGPLSIVWLTTRARGRAERDSERLHALVAAANEIQHADDGYEQERAVLGAARALFPLRAVSIEFRPPTGNERGAPLWVDPACGRWLVVAPTDGCDPWRTDDTRMLVALAGAAATAVDRARLQQELEREANIDPLTGLANRRCLERELALALAGNPRGVAVMLLDLDGFKQINDRFGHDTGDRLLSVVAQKLSAWVRANDLVARLGGDEFVIMLPGVTSGSVAQRVVESIQATFAAPIDLGDVVVEVALSIGVAVSPGDGRTASDLLRRADRLMYRQKYARRAAPPAVLAASAR